MIKLIFSKFFQSLLYLKLLHHHFLKNSKDLKIQQNVFQLLMTSILLSFHLLKYSYNFLIQGKIIRNKMVFPYF